MFFEYHPVNGIIVNNQHSFFNNHDYYPWFFVSSSFIKK